MAHVSSELLLPIYHVRYLATLALGSSNLDQPFSKRIQQLGSTLSGCHFGAKTKVAIFAPKQAKPFGTAPSTLILDPVFLIWID
jgi:hypothetical protein